MNALDYFHNYIDYYKNLQNPGYAVLITGEWGSGKTYQIKKALKDEEMYYVSLFGLTSPEEIHSAVFYKMSPIKSVAKGIAQDAGEANFTTDFMSLGLGKIAGKIASAIIKEEVKNDKVIVFDDIERCIISTNEVLGAINKYVEHHGCRVIAIAHDEKIEDSFKEAKEKLIGQTLRVQPDIDEVYTYFLQEVKFNQSPEIIKKSIKRIFYASECLSLRILKHTINDCFRLYKCLDERHRKHEIAMEELFLFFSALSISYRYGEIQQKDLTNRLNKKIEYHVKKEKDKPPALIILEERYKKNRIHVDLTNLTLSDSIIVNTLVNGYYDKDEIKKHLDSTVYFSPEGELQPWYTIMNFDKISNEIVDKAIFNSEQQIKNLELTEPGDILHTFILRFLMSSIHQIPLSHREVLAEAKCYLINLTKAGKLPPININERYPSYRDSAFGYAYWIRDEYKSHTNQLFEYLNHYRTIAFKKTYPEIREELLSALRKDIDLFCGLISYSSHVSGKYSYVDILRTIKPDYFVEEWLKINTPLWQKVATALKERYTTNTLQHALNSERIWLEQVKYYLKRRAACTTGFDSLRILRLIPDDN